MSHSFRKLKQREEGLWMKQKWSLFVVLWAQLNGVLLYFNSGNCYSPPVNGQAIRPAESGVYNRLSMWPITPGPHNLRRTVPVSPENITAEHKVTHGFKRNSSPKTKHSVIIYSYSNQYIFTIFPQKITSFFTLNYNEWALERLSFKEAANSP